MNKIHPYWDFHAMTVFMQAARDENLTATAKSLCMSPSAVSKAIARLENELNVRLLNRSPRAVSLTHEGSRFYMEAERLTVAVERARNAIKSPPAGEQTPLNVVLPLHFGRVVVCPKLPLYLARNPDVALKFMLINNGQIDAGDNNFDLGIFLGGDSHDSNAEYCFEHLAERDMVLCASPGYISQYGQPDSITDLDSHQILGGFDQDSTNEIIPWRINYMGREIQHQPRFALVSNSIEVLATSAEFGVGIALLPDYVASEGLLNGTLIRVLANYHFNPLNVEVFYKRSRAHEKGVVSFLDLLQGLVHKRDWRSPSAV